LSNAGSAFASDFADQLTARPIDCGGPVLIDREPTDHEFNFFCNDRHRFIKSFGKKRLTISAPIFRIADFYQS
jgi:hypothetical protein